MKIIGYLLMLSICAATEKALGLSDIAILFGAIIGTGVYILMSLSWPT